ncbi:ATP-dependent DNA helicase RecG [Liberiplasma polymorphum]|uniref:ATP-dependent DNA helicase RecG n=1 Tax=Liberiplasma polymorphum TaxID=3374570 RepID=UPI003772E3F6
MSLSTLKGVGIKTLSYLQAENFYSCQEIVNYFPKRYDARFLSNLSDIQSEHYHYIKITALTNAKIISPKSNMNIITFKAQIDQKEFLVKVFNQRFLLRIVKENTPLVTYAKQDKYKKELLAQKVFLASNFKEAIYPIYNIESINDNLFSKLVTQCLSYYSIPKDIIPEALRKKYQLIDIQALYQKAHQPEDLETIIQVTRRLKYEELFIYQLKIQYIKYLSNKYKGISKSYKIEEVKAFIQELPYELHPSQKNAVNEIFKDLKSHKTMNRMLQGDTGSGKTIVAYLAMLACMSATYQVAFMAPTELLAEQQYAVIKQYTKNTSYKVKLLTGSTPKESRKEILEELSTHKIDAIVGTHALFSPGIKYNKLGLVITDEQHRFGVNQRKALEEKGQNPDILYLSATPIPRTLAHTFFGDMDVTTLDSRVDKATNMTTKLVAYKDKPFIRRTMQKILENHEQIYIVAPNIDDTENQDIKGVYTVYNTVKKRYPNARVELLHGKLKADEKNTILRQFKHHEIDILVSTTVIEVGIHIPNASLMIIYHAERFGYAQLHQLRGRVGRGDKPGICLLIHDNQEESVERLKVLETVHDGFILSEQDLANRGFGDLVGIMQSGFIKFNYASSKEDLIILKHAKEDAETLILDHLSNHTYIETIEQVKSLIKHDEQQKNMI